MSFRAEERLDKGYIGASLPVVKTAQRAENARLCGFADAVSGVYQAILLL